MTLGVYKDREEFTAVLRDSNENNSKFKVVGQSHDHKWKLTDIDTSAIQEKFGSWVSKTQSFLKEKNIMPLVKTGQVGKPKPGNGVDDDQVDDILLVEQTISSRTPKGVLSLAAVVSIEQFSRMNGLTGLKMQRIFKALVPEPVYNDARNLVEYCCFRFLSRDNSDVHPNLMDPAFQRLIFITMLAWDNPYLEENTLYERSSEKDSFQGKFVREEAFVRIAPSIPGVANRATAYNLFKALAGDEDGISFVSWLTYVKELIKVHKARKAYQIRESPQISGERILCIGSSRKRPVLKWKNNMAWPGKLTLTDKALYFEKESVKPHLFWELMNIKTYMLNRYCCCSVIKQIGLQGEKDALRIDLTRQGLRVEKAKVGPFGVDLFDSAVSISAGPQSESWVLEFIDLGGELRRDVWHAFISEVISLHKFVNEYGPSDTDLSLLNVYGSHKGKEKATNSTINGIASLQALQYMKKLLDDPIKLVQFSYLQNIPYGHVVCQALAVNFWGGALITKFTEERLQPAKYATPSDQVIVSSNHVFDIDGSVYLRKWMKSPSWFSTESTNFWKNCSVRDGIVLSKNLVVADTTIVEKAAAICKKKYRVVEKTQDTINAATLEGIPNNIDLFKELLLPLTIIANYFEKVRRWEEPHLTISFVAVAYTIIFRDLLSYVFPMSLIILASTMLMLKGLKQQGRLGRSFAQVTVHDQPPSNTIQKIIALKDAMRDVENYLQSLNVTLLKIRSIMLSGHPQIANSFSGGKRPVVCEKVFFSGKLLKSPLMFNIEVLNGLDVPIITTEVALALLCSGTILLVVPFKYVVAFLIFDLFTRELEFRKEMVKNFRKFLKERWDMVPASPVIVLPFSSDEPKQTNQRRVKDEPWGIESEQ
ncbi:hypothetical protein ACFE04_001544 [Oxalis oulophora]